MKRTSDFCAVKLMLMVDVSFMVSGDYATGHTNSVPCVGVIAMSLWN